ncbi:bifunctional DNA primase/polymerase [Nocardia sp. NPDC049190]|uniref:bifunctional DNA primase/polymerase n=1 Tax=Nocardia sp. NPDC049190 TaxID=3155650 RepID=UPI0033F4508A
MHPYHFRDVALRAARCGWHVLPLRPGSKIPAIKHWQREATIDETQITALWPRYSVRNVGIACGPSRLHVLDLDEAHGHYSADHSGTSASGRAALSQLAATRGLPMPLPTYTVATPSGGLHLYYQTSQKPLLRNSISRLGPHIDTRGDGGYIVAAGSVLTTGCYRLIDDQPPIQLPDWLATALCSPPRQQPVPQATTLHHATAYATRAVDNQAARVRAAATGTRHWTLLLAANSLGRLVGRGILSSHDAYSALYNAANIHIGIDELTHTEADRTIRDGLDHGARRIHKR